MSEMDKIWKDKIYNHHSPMPDHIWGNIEEQLKKQRKKRPVVLFWIGGIAFAALALSMVILPFLTSDHSLNKDSLEVGTNLTDKASLIESQDEASISLSVAEVEPIKVISEELSFLASSKKPATNSDDPVVRQHIIPISNSSQQPDDIEARISLDIIPDEASDSDKFTEKFDAQRKETQFLNLDVLFPSTIKSVERLFPDPIGCPTIGRSYDTPPIFVEAYYKPFYAQSLIQSNSAEIGEEYIRLRTNSESPLYSWAAGISLGWISNYNLGVKTGVEFEEINERFTYEDPDAIQNQTVITIDTTFNPDGSFTTSADTVSIQVSGTELQRIYNYHRTLSIPLMGLYHVSLNDFALEFAGGPIFNISYWNRGKIVDPSNADQWFTKGRTGAYDVYNNRFSVSLALSVNAMYSLNENIQLFARPSVKYNLASIARNSSPFSQRYLNSGVALGVRYYFSGNPNY